jgi:hypothetical protein
VSFENCFLILIADHSRIPSAVTACLSLIIPIKHLTILSSIAIVGGLYFFFLGLHLLARKRLLLTAPRSQVRGAALGLIEVNGRAAGPNTVSAPISGKPCFLYQATVWQYRHGRKQEWERVADETLHLPFFVDDSTGQLLVEPLGADLDLNADFREEYDSTSFTNLGDAPPRVSVFLARHGIVPYRRLRVEERLIKPEDVLFVAGTLTENPGIPVRPFSPHRDSPRRSARNSSSEPSPAPEIVKLSSGPDPSSNQEMSQQSQQSKIAAALTRAGITRPEAWSAAGVPHQSVAVDENGPHAAPEEARPNGGQATSPPFNLNPPVVLMKGDDDPTLVVSFRSQKELAGALARKSAALLAGGAAITLLGVYTLLAHLQKL